MAGSNFDQQGSRIANATRTWQEAEDTPVTGWTKEDDFIIAGAINTTTHGGNASGVQLRWRNATDSGSFAALSGTGELNWTGTTDLSDGSSITAALAGCSSAGTFRDGIEQEGSNSISASLAQNYWTEFQWAIDSSGATDGKQYEFEIYDTGAGAAIAVTPLSANITMSSAGISVPVAVHHLKEQGIM